MYSPMIRFAGVCALALTLSGCTSVTVRSFEAPGQRFNQYKTFNWDPGLTQSTGDPRLDNNRFFHDRVRVAVEKELTRRGLERADAPDLLIHYHASVSQEIQIRHTEVGEQYEAGGVAEVYDTGTLLIDLVDASNHHLVWRGWAEDSIDGVIENQDWMEKAIDQAVMRILRKLPQGL